MNNKKNKQKRKIKNNNKKLCNLSANFSKVIRMKFQNLQNFKDQELQILNS